MDLYPLGLLETLRAYREGRATVQDYITSCSQRIADLEARVQAWEWFDPSRAMAEAEERAGGILQDLPLFGIPVGVKDIIATRGIPTRYGSRIFAGNVPTHSAWIVRRLEALGGLVMGKTVTTEFAYRSAGQGAQPVEIPRIRPAPGSRRATARRRLVAAGFDDAGRDRARAPLGSVIRPAAFLPASWATSPRTAPSRAPASIRSRPTARHGSRRSSAARSVADAARGSKAAVPHGRGPAGDEATSLRRPATREDVARPARAACRAAAPRDRAHAEMAPRLRRAAPAVRRRHREAACLGRLDPRSEPAARSSTSAPWDNVMVRITERARR